MATWPTDDPIGNLPGLCTHAGERHAMVGTCRCTGPRFSIKMSSYLYRKSHCGDKTVVRSSYLHNGISYTGKMSSLYWTRGPLVGITSWRHFIFSANCAILSTLKKTGYLLKITLIFDMCHHTLQVWVWFKGWDWYFYKSKFAINNSLNIWGGGGGGRYILWARTPEGNFCCFPWPLTEH